MKNDLKHQHGSVKEKVESPQKMLCCCSTQGEA